MCGRDNLDNLTTSSGNIYSIQGDDILVWLLWILQFCFVFSTKGLGISNIYFLEVLEAVVVQNLGISSVLWRALRELLALSRFWFVTFLVVENISLPSLSFSLMHAYTFFLMVMLLDWDPNPGWSFQRPQFNYICKNPFSGAGAI